MVLYDDNSSMLADDVQKKQVSQENASDKDKSVYKHSENALEPKKKRKEKDNVTLPAAVKHQELLQRINDFPSIKDVTLQICKNAGVDQRCYNHPTADQVAAIWVEGNNPDIPYDRDIILHGTDGHKHIIKHYFGCYDPLQYPLLFPNGENGWHQNIPKFKDASIVLQSHHEIVNPTNFSSVESIIETEQRAVRSYNNRMVSCREYYCYKFQIRNQNPSVLLYARRLLQQYAVDMYIKLETTRLDYCRNNQAELRSEYLSRHCG
ncbi:uncharacterized protein [Primulina eburnea]|uniref:uncharacterized protein n=1 Tax=Primulina eburnea TaxID=1245227 RepID=UPI003C6C5DD0